jgi:hypothetical protein
MGWREPPASSVWGHFNRIERLLLGEHHVVPMENKAAQTTIASDFLVFAGLRPQLNRISFSLRS